MTLDDIIPAFEADLEDALVDAAKAGLAALFPGFLAFILTPFGVVVWAIIQPGIRWIAGQVVKGFDSAGYLAYKSVVNNGEASDYEDAKRNTDAATESGDMDAIKAARAKQRAAFLALYPLLKPSA